MTEFVSNDRRNKLNQFTRMVWGNSQAVLRPLSGSPGVEYIDVASCFDALRFIFKSALSNDKILVRDEYRTALRELQTDTYSRGAYVTGQPGIGKTLFLVYLLVELLGRQQMIAVQFRVSEKLLYAVFGDTVRFYPTHDTGPLDNFPVRWALSDSNDTDRSPDDIFYGSMSHIRTIQATSPKEIRWKEWSKQAGAKCYIMDIWSENEIADLAKLLRLDVERMTTLATLWGGVPRRLLGFLPMQDHDIEEEYSDGAELAVRKCEAALSATLHMNLVEEGPSRFYFCRPRKTEHGISRMRTSSCVPTSALRRLLGEALRRQDNAVKLNFFRALSQPSETRSAAGCIFESWFHIYMSAAEPIQCHWVQGLDGVTTLAGTDTLIPSTWAAVKAAVPPYYWPAPKNCPGIDSALVLDGVIYVFQVTIRPQHKTPYDGLQKLRGHLPAELKDLPWRVVFVGDSDRTIATVAHSWVGKLTSPTGQAMSIGWSKVYPVMEDVAYREIREESDPDDVSMEDATE